MTSAEQPAWLKQAVALRQSLRRTPEAREPVAPGQIRRLEPMDLDTLDSRLVLVISVDHARGFATVVGLSADTFAGSDVDRLVPQDVTGLAYELVALPDVSGPAWLVQLGVVLAVVDPDLDALPPAGIGLRDSFDARWAWKEHELDALVALTAECRLQLLDGEPATVADPAAFDLGLVGVSERSWMALEVSRLLDEGCVLLPAEALEQPIVPRSSKAYESFVVLMQLAPHYKDQLLAHSASVPPGTAPLRGVTDDPLPAVLTQVALRLGESARCIWVKTVESLWPDPASPAGPRYCDVVLAGRRRQLVISTIDSTEVQRA